MTAPIPTLDHVVINVRDQLDTAEALYRRLGFHLTPRGHHTLGSMNNLAIFGTDYLELIAVPPGKTDRNDILGFPQGLNGLVFNAEKSDRLAATLQAAGVPASAPNDFSRQVDFEGGTGDAAFRTVRIDRAATPAGRVYFCEHKTRHLVWRDEWRHHPNGVIGVSTFTIASHTPDAMAGLFARMFGADAVVPIQGGHRLPMALSSCDIVTPETVKDQFGEVNESRPDHMAALTFRVKSIAALTKVLDAGEIPHATTKAGLTVSAAHTMGATLAFTTA